MRNRAFRDISSWIVLIILAFYALVPIFLLFLNAFKTRGEIFSNPWSLPKKFTFTNFKNAWRNADLRMGLLNSLKFAVLSSVIVILVGGPAAYILSRATHSTSRIMLFLLFCNTLPLFVLLIPLFVWFRKLGFDNIFGVVIITVGLSLPFSMMLLRSFLVTIPRELEEAASLDGANGWQIFWKIVFPIASPGFLTVGLMNFLGGWNAFTIPVTFLSDPGQQTAIVRIYTLSGQYTAPWEQIFAAIVIMILPLLVLFLSLQRYFVKGIIGGAFK